MTTKENKKNVYIKAYEPWSDILFTEPFAIPLTRILAAMKVNPNAVTIVSLLSGLASGIVFATGHWFWGALVFQFAYFCDCLDGKVARLRGMTSKFGAKLDVFADGTRKPSSFIGIAVYFYLNNETSFVILSGAALIVHVCLHKLYQITGVAEYDLEFPEFHRNIIRRYSPRILALYTFFDEQFIQFVVFPIIAVVISLPKGAIWFFYGVGLVTLLGLLKLINSLNYRQKGKYDQIYQNWAATGGNLDK